MQNMLRKSKLQTKYNNIYRNVSFKINLETLPNNSIGLSNLSWKFNLLQLDNWTTTTRVWLIFYNLISYYYVFTAYTF